MFAIIVVLIILAAALVLPALIACIVLDATRGHKAYIARVMARQEAQQRNTYNRLCGRYEYVTPVKDA